MRLALVLALIIPVGLNDGSMCLIDTALPEGITYFEVCYVAPDQVQMRRKRNGR